MEVIEILNILKQKGVDIFVKEEQLHLESNEAELSDDLLVTIRENKGEIIAFLVDNENSYSNNDKISSVETSDYYPTSAAQKRLFFLQELSPSNTAYNLPLIHYLGSSHSKEMIHNALIQLCESHESLLTYFDEVEGEIVQKLGRSSDFVLEYHSCESVDLELFVEYFFRPFNLRTGLLFRACLADIGKEDYVLLIDIHHIICDGISQQILLRHFLSLLKGEQFSVSDVTYKDFSVWQNNLIESPLLKKQRQFWKVQHNVLSGQLDFPTSRQRPAQFTFKGRNKILEIDQTLTHQIREFGRRTNSTLQMVMLTALNILLNKYLGTSDFTIGCGIAGRNHDDLNNVVGTFVNTLPFKNIVYSEQSCLDFHRQVSQNCILGYDNQDIQLEEIIEILGIERDLSRNPLFDVAIFVQNFHHHELSYKVSDNIDPEILKYKTDSCKLDLAWFVNPRDSKIEINLEYYAEIFDSEFIEDLCKRFLKIIKIVVTNENLKIEDIKLIEDGERDRILLEFVDGPESCFDEFDSVHQQFDLQSEITPNKTAVVDENGSYTYSELKKLSDKLASELVFLGVGKNSRIGILQQRNRNLIVSILAILKVGAAYVPFDPEHPISRMTYIANDTKIELLLVDREHFKLSGQIICKSTSKRISTLLLEEEKIVLVDNENREIGGDILINSAKVRINDLAYIMYTSGSTGAPKGVMIEHSGILRLVKQSNFLSLNGTETLLSTMAPSFDFSVFEYWSMLLNGGKLVMCSKKNLVDNVKLTWLKNEHNVNTIMFSSGLLNQLIDSDIAIFGGLKTLLAGGEKLSLKHIRILKECYPSLEIINAYGPTEDTSIALTYTFGEYPDNVPIGKPINNTSVYILDKNLDLCAIGVKGEIYLGGNALARGYLNLAELTKSRFILNPFKTGERLYRTGDFGYWQQDGNVGFLGREDDQIKIRGYRVELAEIEQQIQSLLLVDTAVVVVEQNLESDVRLHAFYTSEKDISPQMVREYLIEKLPSYMIPVTFTQIDSMPLTISGKVDKRKLFLLNETYVEKNKIEIIERSDSENKLFKIWAELFGREDINIDDNFFVIGGHSLKAMKLVSEIKREFDCKISLEKLFRNPTIAGIAEELDREKNIVY